MPRVNLLRLLQFVFGAVPPPASEHLLPDGGALTSSLVYSAFSAQYRRLRQNISSLTVELGRMVAVSDLPPEITHRLLQENAEHVVPGQSCCGKEVVFG